MKKSKTTTDSKLKPKKKQKCYNKPGMVKLADGTEVMQEYANQYPMKNEYKEKQQDWEDMKPVKDEASKHRYPPPKNHPVFRKRWMSMIDNIVERDSFKDFHLHLLEVLCDIYVEYEALAKILRTEGRTYKSITRFGIQIKTRPEVPQMDRLLSEIRAYAKQLDLSPKKDNSFQVSDDEEDSWD